MSFTTIQATTQQLAAAESKQLITMPTLSTNQTSRTREASSPTEVAQSVVTAMVPLMLRNMETAVSWVSTKT